MIFSRKNYILGPQITRKGPKFTILVVRFFNVSSMSESYLINTTRSGGEDFRITLFYSCRGKNERVWSNLMISNVSMTVEKCYGNLVFHQILIVFGMSILSMILWSQICWLSQGFPRKIFDLHGVVIGDNKGLITFGRWGVQTVCKDVWKFEIL